jgi:hypothetical protein
MENRFKTNLSFLTKKRLFNVNNKKKSIIRRLNKNSNNRVSNVSNALKNINNKSIRNKNGYSFLIRVKNEEGTIKKCILDIVDIADEIIVVLNNSTDKTESIVKNIIKKHSNVKLFYYDIDVPRYGDEHIKNFNKKGINIKMNTLATYYNWVESKSSYNKKIKWDGDFYPIRENLIEMLDHYKNKDKSLAVNFSGLTLFKNNNNLFVKDKSYYDEYRLFLNERKNIWTDNIVNKKNYCETSIHFGNKCINKYIWTKPIFYEVKNCQIDEFSSRSNSLPIDGRDKKDFKLMNIIKNNKIIGELIRFEDKIHNKFVYKYDNNKITENEISISKYKLIYKTPSWQLSKHYFKYID